ncbi:hypothetical protein KYC_12593 [Achromobacter arsenitoxydans SY8]|uniref:Uncharacterized protein n=2 Tax=Achromobacter TaxID=222 RepID=H0F6Q8_9BURK|nr:hypothetical protein KYC_12593 [Achromobacter arsenitoxydans SY8]
MAYRENIQFSVMFCNDVRLERDGQVTYVGVYQPHLTVKEFPYSFRGFCVVLNFMAPVDVLGEQICFQVFRNDKVVMEFTPDSGEVPTPNAAIQMSINMEVESLEISEPTKFYAQVAIGEKVYRSRNVLNVTTEPFSGTTEQGRETKPLMNEE